MAFQPVPETAQIDMVYDFNGEVALNSFYARRPGGYAQSDLQALADKIDLAWAATFPQEQPPEVSYVRTDVRGLASINDLTATQNLSAGPGVHVGPSLPNNVTFSIKKNSGQTGRSARGRTFWIGVPRNEVGNPDENHLLSTWAANCVSDIDFIRIQIGTVGLWEAVLVSRFANGVKRTEGELFPWISTSNVDLVVDTNRGRLPS